MQSLAAFGTLIFLALVIVATGCAGNAGGTGEGAGGAAGTAGSGAGGTSPPGAGGAGTSTGGAAAGSGGAAGNDPCGASNAATVPLPAIPAGSFDVTSYGAVGDGKTNNTSAIQAALNAASTAGGGTVTIPSGTFL